MGRRRKPSPNTLLGTGEIAKVLGCTRRHATLLCRTRKIKSAVKERESGERYYCATYAQVIKYRDDEDARKPGARAGKKRKKPKRPRLRKAK